MTFNLKTVKSPIRNTEVIVKAKKHLDLYHSTLSLSWIEFNALFVIIFVIINLLFGFLYWLNSDSIGGLDSHSYINYFFSAFKHWRQLDTGICIQIHCMVMF